MNLIFHTLKKREGRVFFLSFWVILLFSGCLSGDKYKLFYDPILENKLVFLVNEERKGYRCPPLRMKEDIRKVARSYSELMMRENFFSHVDLSGNKVSDRLKKAGISFLIAAENLALVKNIHFPAKEVIQAWMNNPSHRKNILSFTTDSPLTGIGVITDGNGSYVITQILLHPKQKFDFTRSKQSDTRGQKLETRGQK